MANENVASNSGTPHISRWWRVVGGMSMNLALGSLYAWSVFVAPLEKEFRLEAGGDLQCVHHRGGGVRADLHRGWPAAGQDRAFQDFSHWRRSW